MPSWFPHNLADAVLFVPLRIVFLMIVAAVLRFVLHRLINRMVRRSIEHQISPRFRATKALAEATTITGERRSQRLGALGSLARSVTTVIIVVVTVIMVLAEMGFNIATILAGTSIAGIAIAFGVQNIIKDLLSGVFMLIEDQLGVGDFVDMDKASGTVEEVGLRVTQLRDDDGTVWYVRNGEVLRIGNYSQGGNGRPAPEPVEAE